ncbi:hypothetical protein [Ramlibacter sp.]|uniref:hypothetical protein n=1 Tax=Ramlibacter sp. TaxID=1917967 RepID=UPI0017D4F168|nr:hypothetical protein [Ramlibacter sp.]MBA2672768.1 hypothetical protein [Ramlibacter sp.]
MRHLYIEPALGDAWYVGEADTVADATVQALQSFFAELKVLIGNDAVRALYLRALHLALLSFQRPAQASQQLEALLAGLRHYLASRQPAAARSDAQALLESLVALLASLIGQPLTLRLVTSAWGSPTAPPTTTGENRT